jgi:hypothetical protein
MPDFVAFRKRSECIVSARLEHAKSAVWTPFYCGSGVKIMITVRTFRSAWRFLFAVACSLLMMPGCSPDSDGPREFWRPWYELPDALISEEPTIDLGVRDLSSVEDGAAPDLATPQGCTLSVSVTTSSAGGKYAPRNIGAIWISDGTGRFVKSLYVWAGQRAKYLRKWNEVTSAASLPASRVDAISSATLGSHGARSAAWKCTDTTGKLVADGSYQVCFELTDFDGQGPSDCVAFTKGSAPFSVTPADAASFGKRRLDFTP